ncbi:MAG: hypothetical protein JW760_08480 [Spirochaetales bacterium]|nr:hypothetical protein [Spirochaetales bacterium]
MLRSLLVRMKQGYRTFSYPHGPAPELPDRYRGVPSCADPGQCPPACRLCEQACPTHAIRIADGAFNVDLGACLFCAACAGACPKNLIRQDREYRLSASCREDLWSPRPRPAAVVLNRRVYHVARRSLRLRQVSAGGCNACEADTNVLSTLAWDLGRFGIQFVASPRHADGLLVTGPVTENMKEALLETWNAVPGPRLVIAVGACAVSGGVFSGHRETAGGVSEMLPVDLYIPGCPPHPLTILDGLLRLTGRIGK